MEIIVLDTGLISKGEHSYTLAAKLAEALSRRRLPYRMFGTASLAPSITEELAAIPHFQHSLYDGVDFAPSIQRLRSIMALLRGAPAPISSRSETKTWKALNGSFEANLKTLPFDVWNPANLIAVPAISQNQILGLIHFLLRQPETQLPRVVCQLMFPPSWTPWGDIATHGKQFYADAFHLAAPLREKILYFTVENEAMQALMQQDFGIAAKILPVPFDAAPREENPYGTLRLGFFGYSKSDKGFHLLPKAIELCQRQGLNAEFIIQIQHSGWEQPVIEADRALRAHKNVRIVEGVLSSAEYAAWTSQIDVMLLPYDPIAFGGARGSGIFTGSLAAGRPIIASKGTFAGTSVAYAQAEGEVFAPYTSEALAAAIVRLIPRLPACNARAKERAQTFAREHNADAYIDVLMAHARS